MVFTTEKKISQRGRTKGAGGGGRREAAAAAAAGRGKILVSNKSLIKVYTWALQGTIRAYNWAYNVVYNVVLVCRAHIVVYHVFG